MAIGRSRDLKPAPIAEKTTKNQRASNRPLLFHRNGDENMAEQTSFKTRVKEIAITLSKKYKEVFVDHQYLICSKGFKKEIAIFFQPKKTIFFILLELIQIYLLHLFLINAMMER